MRSVLFYFVLCNFFAITTSQTLHDVIHEAIKWRKRAGELECASNNAQHLQETGGWCLKAAPHSIWAKANPIYGPGSSQHVPPDENLAELIAKNLLSFSNGKNVTLYDVGCGIGQFGRYFNHFTPQIKWQGFDGAGNVETFTNGYVNWIDITNPIYDTIPGKADFVMSLEVGEHIPPSATENFINLLDTHNKYGIIVSWAVPKQPGWGHINCKTNEEIAELLNKRGYEVTEWSAKFQQDGRLKAQHPWFRKTFMVFVRKGVVYSG